MFRTLLFAPLLIILSCTSVSKGQFGFWGNAQEIDDYRQAQAALDPAVACAIYTKLSQKQQFILHEIALLRAYLVCPQLTGLAKLPPDLTTASPWLRKLNAERWVRESQMLNDQEQLALAYIERAKISDRPTEKMELLQLADVAAKAANNPQIQKDIETRLYRIAPRLIPAPAPKDWLSVGLDWLTVRRFDRAQYYFNQIKTGKNFKFSDRYLARKNSRNAYKNEPDRDKFLKSAEDLTTWLSQTKEYEKTNEAYVIWARGQWTDGRALIATKILQAAEKHLKGKYPLDEVYFVRGRIYEEQKLYPQALNYFDKALKEIPANADASLKDKILFSKGWVLRRQQNYAEAAKTFADLGASKQDTSDRFRFLFWQAKSLKQAGLDIDAQNIFKTITQDDLLGIYGAFAFRELNLPMPPLPAAINNPAPPPPQIHSTMREMTVSLTAVGEREVLEKYLNIQTEKLKVDLRASEDVWYFFLKGYASAGLYNPLFSAVGKMPTQLKNDLLRDHPELLFPRDYLNLIDVWAKKFSVAPELMLSIIRQESSFDTYARSTADAFGLMQILPRVARKLETETGLRLQDQEELYVPEINIAFGGALIASLQKSVKGQFLLTAASYNADIDKILPWVRTRFNGDPLEFIEDIPYEETRGYVKLVLRNFIFYSRLSQPGASYAFPEWCLDNLQTIKTSTAKRRVPHRNSSKSR